MIAQDTPADPLDDAAPALALPTPATASRGLAGPLAAASLTCLILPLALGAIDAFYALGSASEVEAGPLATLKLAFFNAGLYVPLVAPLALLLGLVLAAAPWDLGPLGLVAGLRRLIGARGPDAAALAGAIWGAGLTLLVGFAGLFKINLFFITAFNHPTLAALTLAVVVLAWGAALGVAGLLLVRALRRLLAAAPTVLAAPALPVALALAALVAAALVIPSRFAETWDALDLRAPVMIVTALTGAWASVGALSRPLRARAALTSKLLPAGILAALIGLLLPTLAWFGASPEDASLVYATRERGLLARVPMALMQSRFDGDGDGYASRLGGGDCDDEDTAIFPGADEILGNGVDEDCDGQDLALGASDPAPLAAIPATAEQKAAAEAAASATQDALAAIRKRHNLVVIIVDTLRWDALGYAGYKRPTSPNIDKLAARALIFDNAYSVSSKTPTAVPPILASRYPSEMPRSYNHFVIYGPENLFMAETLQSAGYHTAASGCHWYFQRKYGYDQGFERWQTYMIEGDQMEGIPTSKQATDTAIRMLKSLSGGGLPSDPEKPEVAPQGGAAKPWFLMVHYLDPHKHYIDHEGFEPFGSTGRDRYDGEIRFVDHHLGRLLAALEEADPGLDDTAIVFTSDHGEAFGEHDHRFHGRDLYEHQIRVPLLIHLPGVPPRRLSERVSLIDLAPTMLDLVKVEIPKSYRGTSLLPSLASGGPLEPRPIYTEMPPGPYNGVFRSITMGDWKLIHRLHGNYYRLFNVADDPGELNDLFKAKPEKANEMKALMQRFRAENLDPIEVNK